MNKIHTMFKNQLKQTNVVAYFILRFCPFYVTFIGFSVWVILIFNKSENKKFVFA